MPEDEAHVNKEGLKDSNGMTETSRWVHDTPRGGHAPVPTPRTNSKKRSSTSTSSSPSCRARTTLPPCVRKPPSCLEKRSSRGLRRRVPQRENADATPRWREFGKTRGQRGAMVRTFFKPGARLNNPNLLPLAATSCGSDRMVRRGSTVRVRQRASRFVLLRPWLRSLGRRRRAVATSTRRPRRGRRTVIRPRSRREA
jgi:hypothetical protein